MARARANGEGSIFPYRNGYAAYAWVVTPTGQRKRKYVYGKTRDDVHAKWIKLQERSARGAVPSRVPKLGEYLEYWLQDVVRSGHQPKTAETYAIKVRLYINPWLKNKRLDKLSVQDVRRWLAQLAETCQCCMQGKDAQRASSTKAKDAPRCCAIGECCRQVLSRATIADARSKLREALNNAITEELISRNVASLTKLPRDGRVHRSVQQSWSIDEARRFLVSARQDDDPFYAAYVLILTLGLRRGEVLGLRWPLVELEEAYLWVKHGLQRISGELVLGPTKTVSSDAPLPLPTICETALRLRHAEQLADKARLGGQWPDPHDLVFTTRYGTPIEPRNFVRSFKRRCAKAGVRPIKVHDTRRTCGSLLAALDVHPRIAMQILRHSKINMTMEVYSQVPSELTRSALKKLGASLEEIS